MTSKIKNIQTPLCINFNENLYRFPNCKFIHACSYCGDDHPRSVCPRRTRLMKKEVNKLAIPVNVSELGKALKKHPNRCFVNYLITSLVQGFLAGLSFLPKVSHVCNNLQLALKEPETVDKLLDKEVEKGYMMGPYDSPEETNNRHSQIKSLFQFILANKQTCFSY